MNDQNSAAKPLEAPSDAPQASLMINSSRVSSTEKRNSIFRRISKSGLFWLNIFTVLPCILAFILASVASAQQDADGSTGNGIMFIILLPFALAVIIADCVQIIRARGSSSTSAQISGSRPSNNTLLKAVAGIVVIGIIIYVVVLIATTSTNLSNRS